MRNPIDVINIIALFLAIWHTVRRLDAVKHMPEQYPHIQAEDFARWKSAALQAHGIVLWACFGYIAGDLAFKLTVLPSIAESSQLATRLFGVSLFVVLLVGTVFGMARVRRAEKLRAELGIDLGRPSDL